MGLLTHRSLVARPPKYPPASDLPLVLHRECLGTPSMYILLLERLSVTVLLSHCVIHRAPGGFTQTLSPLRMELSVSPYCLVGMTLGCCHEYLYPNSCGTVCSSCPVLGDMLYQKTSLQVSTSSLYQCLDGSMVPFYDSGVPWPKCCPEMPSDVPFLQHFFHRLWLERCPSKLHQPDPTPPKISFKIFATHMQSSFSSPSRLQSCWVHSQPWSDTEPLDYGWYRLSASAIFHLLVALQVDEWLALGLWTDMDASPDSSQHNLFRNIWVYFADQIQGSVNSHMMHWVLVFHLIMHHTVVRLLPGSSNIFIHLF